MAITHSVRVRSRLLVALCFFVLCVTLTLGLWPFHAPQNDVTWLKRANGLAFGRHGTVLSRGPLQATGSSGSIELWAQPKRWSGSAALLTLYKPDKGFVFTLRQSLTDLELTSEEKRLKERFYVDDALGAALRQSHPILIAITSGRRGTAVYLDGALAKTATGFQISPGAFSGRLVVGDAVGQSDSFRGEIRGLAIYDRELNSTEILEHFQAWTRNEPPEVKQTGGNIAVYFFDERTGNVVHNHAAETPDLYIPQKYVVLDQVLLEPVWEEFDFSVSYWSGNLKNVVGFLPAGFCFYAYFLLGVPVKRALLVTVVLGFLISLTIEVLQALLPTRDSGTTDLITNTLGTYLGALSYRIAAPILAEKAPWMGWMALPRG